VHALGTNTAGLSPAVDSGPEVCTGIVVDDADAGGAVNTGADTDCPDTNGAKDEDADDVEVEARTDGEQGAELGEAGVVGAAAGDAFRLPACLPMKNAMTQSAIRRTHPTTARLRLSDGLIELT
jgi:hypothetical protein